MTKRPKIAPPVGRSVKEWIGATPDSRPPQSVRLRVFDAANGICHISGVKIQPGDEWDTEHVIALADNGENRESNLRPALKRPHVEKTKSENKRRSKAKRQRAAHVGAKSPPKRPLESRNDLASKERLKPSRIGLPPRVGGIRYANIKPEEKR